MTAFFVACAALGGGLLIAQLVLGSVGVDGGGDSDIAQMDEGLQLFSVRALSAGLAFFGIGALAGLSTGLGLLVALPAGVVLGGAAAVGVAFLTRAMLRLEDDGTVRVESAVGASGVVYLTIPAGRQGAGKVHLTAQNRLVELQAVTRHSVPIATGARVLVVDVVDTDVVEVVPDPLPIPSEVPDVVV